MGLHGTYRARALSGGLGFAGNGTEQVGIDLQIIEGPAEGQHITWYGFFTDKAVDRTIESLRILGWEGTNLCDLTGIDKNEVELVIEAEDYEDPRTGEIKTRSRVRWINRAGGLAMKDMMSAQQARDFSARMRGKVVASGGLPKKDRAPGRPSTPTPSRTDDDIPF
jgi:hypothetical protein